MILGKRIENQIEIEGNIQEDIKMSLDVDSTAHLMMLLSTNLYSDNIGTPIQEICSNALDSHIEAGINEPIIVSFEKQETGDFLFSCEDFGLGLDDNDFRNIMSKYGKSTKRDNAEVLGMMGIGSKSFFAYTDSYSYICRKNNVERMYIMRKDDVGFAINLIYEKKTTERNGVKVLVNVPYSDRFLFSEAITTKLAYFENVYFNVWSNEEANDFKIYEAPDFKYSTLSDQRDMSILLGRINYKLDFDKLGIKPIQCPIALKFGLSDSIFPSPNRETILYNNETKKLILDKIKAVATWFLNKYNETNTEFTDLIQIYSYFNDSNRYVNLGENKVKINSLFHYTDIKCNVPTFKGIEKLRLETINSNANQFLKCYTVIGKIENSRYSGKSLDGKTVLNLYNSYKKLILCKQIPNKKTLEFIKDTIGNCYFIKKIQSYELGVWYSSANAWKNNKFSYAGFLKLYTYPKSEWRQVINEWNMLEKLHEDLFIDVNSIQITKEWEESRKKARVVNKGIRNQKLEGEINFKFAENLEKYSQDWDCKFVSKVLNLKDFHKRPQLVVYGLDEQRRKLDNLFRICKTYKDKKYSLKVVPTIVGQRDYEKLKTIKLHNLMSIDEFEKSFNKPIAKYVTSYKISKFYEKYKDIFKVANTMSKINANFAKSLSELEEYQSNHKNPDNDLMKSLETFCEQHKYYDYPIYETLQEVSKNIDKLDFLKFFMNKSRYSWEASISDEAIPIIQELLKARKFRMDWQYYVAKVDNICDKVEKQIEELELQKQD